MSTFGMSTFDAIPAVRGGDFRGAGPALAADGGLFVTGDSKIAGGGWLCTCVLDDGVPLAGVIRVSSDSNGEPVMYGDLYVKRGEVPLTPDSLGSFPSGDWRYHLHCVRYWNDGPDQPFILEWEFKTAIGSRFVSVKVLRTKLVPVGGDRPVGEYRGSVFPKGGAIMGAWTMVRVADWFREITMEILTTEGGPRPAYLATTPRWNEAFEPAGWKINTVFAQELIKTGGRESWRLSELHDAMIQARGSHDRGWIARLLVVPLLTDTPRGVMFDFDASDSNRIPREGAAVAANWKVPSTREWGAVNPLFWKNEDLFLRTIIHEVGHIFNLEHDETDDGLMCRTAVIASRLRAGATMAGVSAANFRFSPRNITQMLSWPDRVVRPGDWPFTPINPEDGVMPVDTFPAMRFRAVPIEAVVPMGAPVRIDLELANLGTKPIPVPSAIDLKGGWLRGRVTDPSGTVRDFRPLFQCMGNDAIRSLGKNAKLPGSVTLWRGKDGPLFPAPGYYKIELELDWIAGGATASASTRCEIIVMPPRAKDQATTVLHLLSSPDLLLAMAIGGDQHHEAQEALDRALRCKVLRPHWVFTEINRLARPHFKRRANWKKVGELMGSRKDVVSNEHETRKLARWAASHRS